MRDAGAGRRPWGLLAGQQLARLRHQPLLLEVGDSDGTVAWHQGIELYNVARRARKNVVMLAYMGEDHGLRQKKNQIDYQQRILAWFRHYLKDEPAESWITNGKSFLGPVISRTKMRRQKKCPQGFAGFPGIRYLLNHAR